MGRLGGVLLLVAGGVGLGTGLAQDTALELSALQWRMIGPHRGGRTVGATGIADQPNVFFIGVNNGGVWKTEDYGRTWRPIADSLPTGSIGDLAVASSNPEILYVGSGEGLQRPDLSVGDGVFKSTDGGGTWRHMGLEDAQQIAALAVHPEDSDIVWVAVLGHPYGANTQRGVFKSTDGGATWRKTLYVDEDTGAASVVLDPNDPAVLYADLWAARQGPWENGAWQKHTSGLYKSVDGGENWTRLGQGLPGAEQGLGRIGIAIAASDSRILYATVDAGQGGGIYRSDDAGITWRLLSDDERLWGRGDDFAEIKVHPRDPETVFIGNISSYKSSDGGRTFEAFKGAPGGDDYHRIWINPKHPEIMLFAADQGATITVNGGKTWSSWYNQPTAQLYHVSTDDQYPYNVYGGQQESGAVAVSSRGPLGQITFRDWISVGADEYAYVAADPLDPDIVYGGRVTRFDRRTGQSQNVAPEALRSGKYRILRTMPLLFSPADPRVLFFASNVLFKTTNGGQSWDIISPDLSRERPAVPESIGVYRTPEMAVMPRRGVIYALGPSALDADRIWAGTDDGFVHVTEDGGGSWRNVTPPDLTAWSKISQIDAGRFDGDTAYLAVNRIRLDDMRPYIYRTHDGGRTWRLIVEGLPKNGPVNVVREDPGRKGLLFAGTERAVYFSLDDGERWRPLRLNMPATSIRDLVVHGDDVVAGTHGRSIWILDNVTPLRQLAPEALASPAFLFEPQTATRVRWNLNSDTPLPPEEPGGSNPPDGAILDYHLASDASEVTLEILDGEGELVRRFSSRDEPERLNLDELPYPAYWIRPSEPLGTGVGLHRFVWDLHYPPPPGVKRSHPIAAVFGDTPSEPRGPWVHPGRYTVRLTVDGAVSERPLTVRLDPRVQVSEEDLRAQFEASMACDRGYRRAFGLRRMVRSARGQAQSLLSESSGALQEALSDADSRLAEIEGSGEPERPEVMYSAIYAAPEGGETLAGLQQKFLHMTALLQAADAKPTTQATEAVQRLLVDLDQVQASWRDWREGGLKALNESLRESGRREIEVSDTGH